MYGFGYRRSYSTPFRNVRKVAISRGSGACTKPPFSGGRESLDFGEPHVALTVPRDCERAPIDPAIDEALTEFIAKK